MQAADTLLGGTSAMQKCCLCVCWQVDCLCMHVTQELYSHYTQQVKDTCASLADPHKAYLLRKAVHYFNTQRQHRAESQDKPLIEVRANPIPFAPLLFEALAGCW